MATIKPFPEIMDVNDDCFQTFLVLTIKRQEGIFSQSDIIKKVSKRCSNPNTFKFKNSIIETFEGLVELGELKDVVGLYQNVKRTVEPRVHFL